MKRYLCKKVDEEYFVKNRTDAKHLPRGGEFFFLETDKDLKNPTVSTDEDGELVLIEGAETIQDIYKKMVEDIYAEMFTVFGTSNDVSAAAFAATWEAMKKRPSNYVDNDLGLVDEDAVTAYADDKISASDAYAVYRLKRIAQYQAEKEAILNA